MMNERKFIWDESKNRINIKKHRVSFEEARSVFSDKNFFIMPDTDHSFGEERFIILGESIERNLLLVCYCERNENIIRIISARKAEKREKIMYYYGGVL
jgi:hypothetical protein